MHILSDGERHNSSPKSASTGPGSDGKVEKTRSSPVTHNGAFVGVSTPFDKGNLKKTKTDPGGESRG